MSKIPSGAHKDPLCQIWRKFMEPKFLDRITLTKVAWSPAIPVQYKHLRKTVCVLTRLVFFSQGPGPYFTDPDSMTRSFISQLEFDSVLFKCQASGAPPLQYKWLKNGKEIGFQRLSSDLNTRTWYLWLRELILSNTGNYTCIVSNAYGSIRHTYTLRVTRKCCTGAVLHQ